MTESIKLTYMREIFKEMLLVPHDLPGVFFDPHALMDDDQERTAVQKQIATLWDFATTKDDFELKSIQDVLQELHYNQKQNEILLSQKVGYFTKY